MAARFDPLARVYRYLEYASFGRALWRRRVAFLGRLGAARRVLMAGEGDGRFLAAFLRANAEARVDYVDASARMLELARERAPEGRARFFAIDLAGDGELAGPYDTVITHFFLDCFTEEELGRVVVRIGRAATADARWVVSEFQENRWLWRVVVRGLYLFFGATTGMRARRVPDYRRALGEAGFRLEESEKGWAGLLVSESWKRDQG